MTNYEYATWVRGFLQLCGDTPLDKEKIQILKNHLNLVVAVEGVLGEKNQALYDEIAADKRDFQALKTFIQTTYC